MNDNLFLSNDFVTELSESASPGHLDQLELFYENTEELFGSMTHIITTSQMAISYGSSHPDRTFPLAAGEPSGYLLQWPSSRCGLTSIIRSEQDGQCNSFVAAFPFIGEGVKYTCKVLETRLFANRLEAQLVVLAGEDEELCLTFYDAQYLADRLVYKKDAVYQFILRGLVYYFELHSSDQLAAENNDMAALYPREDLGADHYEIQGPVKAVKELDFAMLEQKIWLVRVMMARTSGGEDLEIDLLLTNKVLGKGKMPKPGDDIMAVIWLQGHLWGPVEESQAK